MDVIGKLRKSTNFGLGRFSKVAVAGGRLIKLSGDPDEAIYVWAIMMCPDDEGLRRQLILNRQVHEWLEAPTPIDANNTQKLIHELLNSPSDRSLAEQVTKNTRKGSVVGDILSSIYLMAVFDVKEPSFKKAIFVAQRFAAESTYGDGSKLSASNTALRQYFNEFQPVAHLWAAARLNSAYQFIEKNQIFSSNGLPKLLGVAKTVHDFSTQFVPKRTKSNKPALDANQTWKISDDIPTMKLSSERIPDRLLGYLEEYEAQA